MTSASGERDDREVEALLTDRYIDGLLATHARAAAAADGPAGRAEASVRRTADRLARDLPRFHPSFRFEEALAARLAEVAARMGQAGPGNEGWADLIPIGEVRVGRAGYAGDPRPGVGRRPVLIGGALTSVALSVAGALYVAWRLNRPPSDPMARAVRAVARTRLV